MEKFTFELFRLEAELILNKKVCKNHDFCHTSLKMMKQKILSNITSMWPKRVPYMIYTNTERLQDTC